MNTHMTPPPSDQAGQILTAALDQSREDRAAFIMGVECAEDALKLREEVLVLRRKVNGPGHPDTLKAMGNLALSCREKGEVARAEALEKEVAAAKAKTQAPPPASK